MCKIILEIDSFNWGLVRTRERATLSEDELAAILSELVPEDNPLGIQAPELRDYLDDRGPLVTRVRLMGAEQQIRDLLGLISESARHMRASPDLLERTTVDPTGGDKTVCHRAYTQ